MKMRIAKMREFENAKSLPACSPLIPQFRILAISQLFLVFLLLVVPAFAQTTTTKAPSKVTVTLVRWPYT